MKSKCWEPLRDEGEAVGDETFFIHDEYQRSAVHFLFPFSRQWANPLTRFLTLQKEWEDNTAYLSSMTKIVP